MKTKPSVFSCKTSIVAVIASRKDLLIALRYPNMADIYEWRVDCIHGKRIFEGIERLKRLDKAIILTVRAPDEGGKRPSWDREKRERLIRKYLHLASVVDIEANSAVNFRKLIADIQHRGITVNFSFHVLEPTAFKIMKVPLDWFVKVFELLRARRDIFKVAVKIEDTETMRLFSRHVYSLMKKFPGRVAPMPIGEKYGKRLRLEYARRGAALVYCCLDDAVVPGQWQVSELRRKLA